jgi:hypothetical protein
MKPYTAYEQQVDRALLETIRELGTLARGAGLRDAVMLAALRDQEHRLTRLLGELHIVEAQNKALIGADHRLAEAEVRLKQLEARELETDRSTYLALAELRRRHEQVGDAPDDREPSDGLTEFELRGFSQNGEDGVLAEILTRIGAPGRHFIEFGIEGGREGNCVYLADVANWHGLFIESNPDLFGVLSRKYGDNERVATIEGLVTPENVEDLFRRGGAPLQPDIISIDVDGSDYWIWEAIEHFQPRIVVIEYNSALNGDRPLVQPREHGAWDGTDFFGASLGAIVLLGERKGYRLVHTESSAANAFLVRSDLAEGRFPPQDEVPLRRPNYFQIGYRHPVDVEGRRYLDLLTGELVDAAVDRDEGPV